MKVSKIWFVLCAFAMSAAAIVQAEDAASRKPETLYPFVRDGRWGFIDAHGEWVIEPRFDGAIFIFEKDRVRVEQGDRWGYIDRKGNWLVKPQFTDPFFASDTSAFEVVSMGKKRGVLKPSAEILLPAQYDDIALGDDHAIVRRGEKLGIIGFDGRWIKPLTITWPKGRKMPVPTKSRAAWYQQGHKWGLLSHDGAILFRPQFTEHVMGRHESEEWDHPEGLDFKDARAWVLAGKEHWLITDEGNVLSRQLFQDVRLWTDELYVFVNNEGKQGLISKDGAITQAARFSDIKPLSEGLAVVVEEKNQKGPDGKAETWSIYGYIDVHGKVIVEPGTYAGPGVPFSEGLAPVWNNSPEGARTSTSDPCAGYIDRTGALVIPEQFQSTEPFSDGLAAVQEAGRLGLNPAIFQWGYVDRTGAIAIPLKFKGVTPFCKGRAWVAKGYIWEPGKCAMIDRTGKVLTDFVFEPPELTVDWRNPDNDMAKSRWRGKLAVITQGDFRNGLATADGEILVEPIYNRIGEFHDGISVADSRQSDALHNVKYITSLITERGEILANDTYTEITDFDHGVAWASHRWTDHRGPYQREGWGLIDTSAREVCALKYIVAGWVRSEDYSNDENLCPKFYGEIAPVAAAEGYSRFREDNSWGYVNRAGKVIVWHERHPAVSPKR